jgi:hypothetical protein
MVDGSHAQAGDGRCFGKRRAISHKQHGLKAAEEAHIVSDH